MQPIRSSIICVGALPSKEFESCGAGETALSLD